MVTFAVIGRNDGALLPNALRDVLAAARPEDRVLYVDGASDDGSPAVARAHGVEVVPAPVGKGRAMAVALDAAASEYVLFFDADLEWSERNIARVLRDSLDDDRPDMVVAAIAQPLRKVLAIRRLHSTLVRALFPEAHRPPGPGPLGGFRLLATSADVGRLPPGYGAETHLNIRVVMEGGSVTSLDAGEYRGPTRDYANAPAIGADLTEAILDAAEHYGRLAPPMRAAWERWAAPFIELAHAAHRAASRWEELNERARELQRRPLPSALAAA